MNPLVNILTPKGRAYVYAAFALAGIVLGALNIAGVDTGKTADVLAYIGVALGLTAASNASATPETGKHAKPDEAGHFDVALGLLIAAVIGIALLLFRVHFN